ncbi:MAG: DUF427 domain-containing protein [Bacteroidales bacterium]|nr:DUF427 domain-containing protein [Bacteroidales bacterium]
MKAIWNSKVIAESNETISLEGNEYFPPNSVKKEFLAKSDHHTVCPWKGHASYYDVVVEGAVNKNAAWYYPQPSQKAAQIKDHVAFWRGVQIIES